MNNCYYLYIVQWFVLLILIVPLIISFLPQKILTLVVPHLAQCLRMVGSP